MVKYRYEGDTFVIEDYLNSSLFSSFLPAVAGKDGKPLWSFYNNRGQAMCGFGVTSKDTPITPFDSANSAYQNVNLKSFRTFVKINNKIFEPFNEGCKKTKMYIKKASLIIEEDNGVFITKITYSTVPHQDYAALIRKVELKNISNKTLNIELCDGLPIFFPHGLSNFCYKELVSLMAAYCQVFGLDKNMPFVKFKTSTGDCSEVKEVTEGNGFISIDNNNNKLKNIVDLYNVFDGNTDLIDPLMFKKLSYDQFINQEQQTENKLPCAFTTTNVDLKKNDSFTIYSIYGTFDNEELFNHHLKNIQVKDIEKLMADNEELINNLLSTIESKTNIPLFDKYLKQSLLDNNLRGGFPISLTNNKENPYYIYSRKHGDMERDYNAFNIPSTYYSSGSGNFRDVCQNRRSDIYLYPFIKDYNIHTFFNLIQIDGQNPLTVSPNSFTLSKEADSLENYGFGKDFADKFNKEFTPSIIYTYLKDVKNSSNIEEIFDDVIKNSKQVIKANFGEGYWVDHWTYLVDLLINYRSVYPDKMEELLFNDDYKYFYNLVYVEPRSEKYCYINENKIRQYGAIDLKKLKDENEKLHFDIKKTYWLKDKNDNEIKTNLISKIFNLILTKFSTLDSRQLGIEMECEKPGWNDAMNGLPGIFSSGLSETVELLRLINFSIDSFSAFNEKNIDLLVEQFDLFDAINNGINKLINKTISSFEYWDLATSARELLRKTVHYNVDGTIKSIHISMAISLLRKMKTILSRGIKEAKEIGKGILPSYLIYEVKDYELMDHINHLGYKTVKVKSFNLITLPPFLEAAARSYKLGKRFADKKEYKLIKDTNIYDKKLGIYKTCSDIDGAPFEIGRIHAFSKGWLERECDFLHMTYKYLLGLLKAGLFKEFYFEIKKNFVYNLKPQIYGRNLIENSSFIVPTCNPDSKIHGKGYFARLTGANAELLDIVTYMFIGDSLFNTDNNGNLIFALHPVLSKEFFTKDGICEFTFFDGLHIKYINENLINSYEAEKIIYRINGKETDLVNGILASEIRDGKIKEIECVIR